MDRSTEHGRDRRIGLIVFGAAQIVVGIVCAALALGVAATGEIEARRGIPSAGAAAAPGIVLWGVAALFFVTVGVGSIRARRWAQALSVAMSAVWLAGGTVATLMFAIVGGGINIVAAVVALVILPLGMLLFYRSEATRLTFERLDVKRRWTDRVPRPVLAVMVVMVFGAIALIANVGNPVMPFMGKVISGPPAALTFLGLAALCAFIALQLYRLKENAWWTLVLLQVAGIVLGVLTLMRSAGTAAGEGAGLTAIYRNPLVVALMIVTWLAYFAFLLYLRRFFAIRLLPRTRRDD